MLYYSHPAEEPAYSLGVPFQAQQAFHAGPLQASQSSAAAACQEGGAGSSAQERDHRSTEGCGRGSSGRKRNHAFKHTAGTSATQKERSQTWKQGLTPRRIFLKLKI